MYVYTCIKLTFWTSKIKWVNRFTIEHVHPEKNIYIYQWVIHFVKTPSRVYWLLRLFLNFTVQEFRNQYSVTMNIHISWKCGAFLQIVCSSPYLICLPQPISKFPHRTSTNTDARDLHLIIKYCFWTWDSSTLRRSCIYASPVTGNSKMIEAPQTILTDALFQWFTVTKAQPVPISKVILKAKPKDILAKNLTSKSELAQLYR